MTSQLNNCSYPQIQQNIRNHLNEIVTEKEIKQLEKWSKLKCFEVVFDSTIDNWSKNTSVFGKRIRTDDDKYFLIEDENGEKFGFYSTSDIYVKYEITITADIGSFAFNLKSNVE